MRLERIVFFGTPDFAVPTAEALSHAGRPPLLVVTQPARPAGRGRSLAQPPVARWAEESGLPVAQPESVRESAFLERLRALEPELAVVVAFGQIFRRALLELPQHGCMNLHASLLPAYRGAAPIQAALAEGLSETGVTTMWMERGLDSGPLLRQEAVAIRTGETAVELSRRLARVGAELVVGTIEGLERGEVVPRPQDDAQASYAPRIRKEDGLVDWALPGVRLVDRERAFAPWPGLTTELEGEALRVRGLRSVPSPDPQAPAGTVLAVEGDALVVACGGGSAVTVATVQRAGRKEVAGADFLRGIQSPGPHRFGGRA